MMYLTILMIKDYAKKNKVITVLQKEGGMVGVKGRYDHNHRFVIAFLISYEILLTYLRH